MTLFVETADLDDPVLFQRGVEARRKRVEEAHARVRELSGRVTRIPSVGGHLIDLWRDFRPSERREVLAGFLERVEVRHGASSDLAATSGSCGLTAESLTARKTKLASG